MSEPLWTAQEIAQAGGGQVIGDDFAVSGLSIDSRSVEPGDLFIAPARAEERRGGEEGRSRGAPEH